MRRAIRFITLSSMVLFFASRHTPDKDADQDSGIHGASDNEDVGEIDYVSAGKLQHVVPPRPHSNKPKGTPLSKIKRWIIAMLVVLFLLVASLVGADYFILQPHLQLLTSKLSSYNEFSGEGLAAEVRIETACAPGRIILDITYFDIAHQKDHPEHLFLQGDGVDLQGEIIVNHDRGLLGLHSGYKITSLVTSDNRGKKEKEVQYTSSDTAFLKQVRSDPLNPILASIITTRSNLITPGNGCGTASEKIYDVYVSQDGLKAVPMK